MNIPINSIIVKPGRREVSKEAVELLSESMAESGLFNPITVSADHTLIAGRHRLEAAKLLGWDEIDCHVCDMDELHAKLAEIDENLIRNGLITPRGTNNANIWDTSNRAINVVINNLKGIFFQDDNMEHMAFSVTGRWGERGITVLRITEFTPPAREHRLPAIEQEYIETRKMGGGD